jgi:hypothetical protein
MINMIRSFTGALFVIIAFVFGFAAIQFFRYFIDYPWSDGCRDWEAIAGFGSAMVTIGSNVLATSLLRIFQPFRLRTIAISSFVLTVGLIGAFVAWVTLVACALTGI